MLNFVVSIYLKSKTEQLVRLYYLLIPTRLKQYSMISFKPQYVELLEKCNLRYLRKFELQCNMFSYCFTISCEVILE